MGLYHTGSYLIVFVLSPRSCMVEESGTLESQLEATKVNLTHVFYITKPLALYVLFHLYSDLLFMQI